MLTDAKKKNNKVRNITCMKELKYVPNPHECIVTGQSPTDGSHTANIQTCVADKARENMKRNSGK